MTSTVVAVGFNPCCIGLGIQTPARWRHAATGSPVSILVVLDWVFKPFPALDRTITIDGFQSLLYWIGYSNPMSADFADVSGSRFNPCCIGLGIQTAQAKWGAASGSLFQSLLYWIGYSNSSSVKASAHRCVVSILVVLDWVFKPAEVFWWLIGEDEFQSLLYWIGYSNSRNARSTRIPL